MDPNSATEPVDPSSQFQPTTEGRGGPKWVIAAIVIVILAMFIGLAALALAVVD